MAHREDVWNDVCNLVKTSKESQKIRRKARRLGKEVGAAICEKDGKLYITESCTGTKSCVNPHVSCRGGRAVGAIHTHQNRGVPRATINDVYAAAVRNLDVECILSSSTRDGACYYVGRKKRLEQMYPGGLPAWGSRLDMWDVKRANIKKRRFRVTG